jgi:hypothetical protein
MTGTATAFSIVVGSFCVVALYILIINIYKPYKKTLDAARTQEREEVVKEDAESGTSSSNLPPIMLTTLNSRTLEDLTATDQVVAERRVVALRAYLKVGLMPGLYGAGLKEPEMALLRKTKTAPT